MNVLRLSIAAGALAFGGILFAQTGSATDGAAPQPPAATAPQGPSGPGYGPRDGRGPGERMHRHHDARGGFMRYLDENRDGQISRDEVLAAQKRQLALFERADANSDGTVSRDELRTARDAMRSEYRKRDGQGCRDDERRGRGAPPAAAPSSQAPSVDGKA